MRASTSPSLLAVLPLFFLTRNIVGSNAPNEFGHKFRLAASKTNALVKFHSFESSVVQIAKDDIVRFVDYLGDLFNLDDDDEQL